MIMNSDLANTQIRELCNHKYLIFSIDESLIKPTLSLRKFTMKEKSKEFPWLPNQNDQSVKMHRCHPKWMRPLGSGQIWRQSTIWGGGCHTGRGSRAYHGELSFLGHRWSVHFWRVERDICNSDQPSRLVWWSEIWYARVCQKMYSQIIQLRWHQPSTCARTVGLFGDAFGPVWLQMTRDYFY